MSKTFRVESVQSAGDHRHTVTPSIQACTTTSRSSILFKEIHYLDYFACFGHLIINIRLSKLEGIEKF